MKTTIDLPEELYRRVKIRAAELGTSLRALLMESLQEHLDRQDKVGTGLPGRSRFQTDQRGWPVLKPRDDSPRIIRDDFINRLRDEEGV
jgi:hypothetical protein